MKKMIVNYVYEYENGESEKINEFIENYNEIFIEDIIDKFKGNTEIDPKCWIYHVTTMTWIACTNNFILSLLVKGLIKENNDNSDITILVRENYNSPNRIPFVCDNRSLSNHYFRKKLIILNKIK